ncbi:MAG: rRNA maturation RNase YbeY [Salibacteraceae bacterium]
MISFTKIDDIKINFSSWDSLESWVKECVEKFHFITGDLSFVFMNDEQLLEYNKEFLDHNYYTDIITFDSSELPILNADILISVDRVLDNCKELKNSFLDEFCRVIIHGVLHLMGYKDKTSDEVIEMRRIEQQCLDLRSFT